MKEIGIFEHKKTKKVIEVPFWYNWNSDRFVATYLGRTYIDSEEPSIGRNWIYLGAKKNENKSIVRDE